MKPHSLFALLALLSPIALVADEPSGAAFSDSSLTRPPHSLREAINAGALADARDDSKEPALGTRATVKKPLPHAGMRRQPGRMPVIPPDPAYHYTMRVQRPSDEIDFKMLIKPVGRPCER